MQHLFVAYSQQDILEAINIYGKNKIDRVVTKHDNKNAEMGIHLWSFIEEVYSQASFGIIQYPFVIHPYVSGDVDSRVIVLGDYVEAYERIKLNSFRNNLHCGGESNPCELNNQQFEICRQVMARGSFPYGHVDIMVTEGVSFLAEVNLKGGMRGAQIYVAEYSQRVEKIHQEWLQLEKAS